MAPVEWHMEMDLINNKEIDIQVSIIGIFSDKVIIWIKKMT